MGDQSPSINYFDGEDYKLHPLQVAACHCDLRQNALLECPILPMISLWFLTKVFIKAWRGLVRRSGRHLFYSLSILRYVIVGYGGLQGKNKGRWATNSVTHWVAGSSAPETLFVPIVISLISHHGDFGLG